MDAIGWSQGRGIAPDDLPASITRYLVAHQARDLDTAVARYSPCLAGDFPGGAVDLHVRFTVRDGLIARLVIEP